MIVEFSPHRYVDIDNIVSLQWLEDPDPTKSFGAIFFRGEKFMVTKDMFDIIESAYLYNNKSFMCDDKLKKIRWVKGE